LNGSFNYYCPQNLGIGNFIASGDGLNSLDLLVYDFVDNNGNILDNVLYGVVLGGYQGGLIVISDYLSTLTQIMNGT